ncbi:MAG: hypothetical protein P9M13_05285 [Candidatus Ancaeobacter aquaticus]|nr:hypothetical protein [Candidatus Ancaeobacter aquaticus]
MRALICAVLLACFCVTGCETVNVDYVGDTLPQTTHADIFYNQSDVPQDAKIIGRGIATIPEGMNSEDARMQLMHSAESKGANAVLVGKTTEVKTGATTWGMQDYPYNGFGGWGNCWEYGPNSWIDGGGPYDFGPTQIAIDYALKCKLIFLEYPND